MIPAPHELGYCRTRGIVARDNIRLHRRIGRWGIAYGCAVIVMGLIVGPASAVIKFNSACGLAIRPPDHCLSHLAT